MRDGRLLTVMAVYGLFFVGVTAYLPARLVRVAAGRTVRPVALGWWWRAPLTTAATAALLWMWGGFGPGRSALVYAGDVVLLLLAALGPVVLQFRIAHAAGPQGPKDWRLANTLHWRELTDRGVRRDAPLACLVFFDVDDVARLPAVTAGLASAGLTEVATEEVRRGALRRRTAWLASGATTIEAASAEALDELSARMDSLAREFGVRFDAVVGLPPESA